MRATITKKIMGLALSAFSLTAAAQCPTINSVTLSESTFSPGIVNVTANLSGAITASNTTFGAYANGVWNNFGMSNSGYVYFQYNGTYSVCVNYSDSTTNCYGSNCAVITVTNASTYSATTTNCPTLNYLSTSYGSNGLINITANYSGTISSTGNFFSFENGSAGFGNSNTGSITYANNGYYTPCVYYVDSTNNCWSSACDSVNITNATNTFSAGCFANADFYIFQDSVNLGNFFAYNNSTTSGSATYVWDFGDGTTSTQAYPFHQYASAGIYTICLTATSTDSAGTCSDTYCLFGGFKVSTSNLMNSFTVKNPNASVGVKENNIISSLNAFPNPMTDELTIDLLLANNSTKLFYTMVDALGKVVSQKSITDSKTVINTDQLEQGFYFLSFSVEIDKK